VSGNLFGCLSSELPPNRHPERSASQIYRVTQCSAARSRRTPAVLIVPMVFEPFDHRSLHFAGPRYDLSRSREQELLASCDGPRLIYRRRVMSSGFGGRKV
jgi:hypothetical protein